MKNLLFVVVVWALASCAVVPVQQPVPMARVARTPFGPGGIPIPPRPPVPLYGGQMGVQAPFSDNISTVTVKNSVMFMGQKPLIITRLWVAGVETPIMHEVRMYDHVFPVRFIPLGGIKEVSLPPSQFLDGSGEGKVRVAAQAASWRLDLAGRIVPSNNVACIEDTIRLGEWEVLDWNHRIIGMIACPEQGVASK